MNRDKAQAVEAAALGVELLELANAGAWPQLLALDLSGDALEILRRKAQINGEIGSLEREEALLWEMLLVQLAQQGTINAAD